jgi:hypothetical protein
LLHFLVSLWAVPEISGLENTGLSETRRILLEHSRIQDRQDPGETWESTHREWKYKDNSLNGIDEVTVLLPGGSSKAIVHRLVTHAEKTLDALTSLDGSSPEPYKRCRRRRNNGWTQLETVNSTVAMFGSC